MFQFLDLTRDPARWENHSIEAARISPRALSPHADLIRIEGDGPGPRHLLVPPVSGHAGTLMLDLVHGLLTTGPVEIVEMHDPSSRPIGDPETGLQDQRFAVTQALAQGPPAHLIGACQSTAATLAAAGQNPETLKALTLIAAPVSDVESQAGVSDRIPSEPGPDLDRFLAQIDELTRRDASGRSILPGDLQLAAIFAGKGGASRVIFEESCAMWNPAVSPARRARAQARIRILSRSRSIDRGLLIEGLEQNFVRRDYRGALHHIQCPVHLVAGENDSVIPAAEVFGAAELFPSACITQSLIPDADHFDLFCGEAAMQLGHSIGEFPVSERGKATI